MKTQTVIGIWLIIVGLITLTLSLELNPWFWGFVTLINFIFAIILFKLNGVK